MRHSGDKLFNELAVRVRLPIVLESTARPPDEDEQRAQDDRCQRLLAGLSVLERPWASADDAQENARELQRLENKLDLALLMMSEHLQAGRSQPPSHDVVFSAAGFAVETPASQEGVHRCALSLEPAFPLTFDWWVSPARVPDPLYGWRFMAMSERLHDALVRWVFRQHRRHLAGRVPEA